MSDIKLEFYPDNKHFKFIAYRRGDISFRATTLTKALTKCFKQLDMLPVSVQIDYRDFSKKVKEFYLFYSYERPHQVVGDDFDFQLDPYRGGRWLIQYQLITDKWLKDIGGETANEVLYEFNRLLLSKCNGKRR